jgi:hypothetical protein
MTPAAGPPTFSNPAREPFMSSWTSILRYCVRDGVPRRSLGVSLIVGSILNLINQGDALLGRGDLDWPKLMLTYIVPYCVATYSAVSYRRALDRRAGQVADSAQ